MTTVLLHLHHFWWSALRKLLSVFLKSVIGWFLDPMQFAYKSNRSTADATLTLTHFINDCFEDSASYAHLLLIDFSSAFNTLQPHLLIKRLSDLVKQLVKSLKRLCGPVFYCRVVEIASEDLHNCMSSCWRSRRCLAARWSCGGQVSCSGWAIGGIWTSCVISWAVLSIGNGPGLISLSPAKSRITVRCVSPRKWLSVFVWLPLTGS